MLASELYDLIAVDGETSKSGPGVSLCDDKLSETRYTINFPWSVTGPSTAEFRTALEGLRKRLPAHDWKIVSYGPDSSRSRSLQLIADSTKRRFSVSIRLFERVDTPSEDVLQPRPAGLYVHLVSGCFEVPEGETVTEY